MQKSPVRSKKISPAEAGATGRHPAAPIAPQE